MEMPKSEMYKSRHSVRDPNDDDDDDYDYDYDFQRRRPPSIQVPLTEHEYAEIQRKANLYDRFHATIYDEQTPTTMINPNSAGAAKVHNPAQHCLPAANTVVLTHIPNTMRIQELIHSVAGPGGLRFLRIIPGKPQLATIANTTATATIAVLLCFNIASSARDYALYVAKYGFWASRIKKGPYVPPEARKTPPEFVKVEIPGVCVRQLLAEKAKELGIRFNDMDFEDVEKAYRCRGATRVVRVVAAAEGGLEEVEAELAAFRPMYRGELAAPVTVEYIGITTRDRGPQPQPQPQSQPVDSNVPKVVVVTIRFAGVRDACVAMKYFEVHKKWHGKAEFGRDVADRDVAALGWHLIRPELQEKGKGGDGAGNFDDEIQEIVRQKKKKKKGLW